MISEFDLIERYFNRSVANAVLGIGDDAAIVSPKPEMNLVVSTDTLVSGRHFFTDVEPYQLGYKSLAVNLSDMAAMGATPRWVTLSLTLPETVIERHEHWLGAFSDGFYVLAQQHQVELIGGDTTCGPLAVGVQIIGEINQNRWLSRSGAQPDDDIWVSGYLGDAALALKHRLGKMSLSEAEADICMTALHLPTARVELGLHLAGLAHSAIDLSDGLVADLGHILTRSQQSATIRLYAVPASAVMQRYLFSSVAMECLLAGGDDYELCFTAAKQNREAIIQIGQHLQLPLTIIGKINSRQTQQQSRLMVYDDKGEPIALEKKGYDHFAA